jgi:hypothetical protein
MATDGDSRCAPTGGWQALREVATIVTPDT